jgi:hypothetical protein
VPAPHSAPQPDTDPAAPRLALVTVEVSNTYACGRESGGTEHARYPLPGEDITYWLDNTVLPLAGDGHSCGSSENALYEVEITAAPDAPHLVGMTRDSMG